MEHSSAEILQEYGPFDGVASIGGVTYDGERIWFATGNRLMACDPVTGGTVRSFDMAATAGTAFDGEHLYQLSGEKILKLDAHTGAVISSIPTPPGGHNAGLAWAEGTLWLGQHHQRTIHQLDPETGAVLRTIESNRYVTGVTWADGELWHGTWEGDASDIRRIDPESGEVLETIEMPAGVGVSGLEWDGGDRFLCGGGKSGKVRAVRRPSRHTRTASASRQSARRA